MNWSDWMRRDGRTTWTAHGALHEGRIRPLSQESLFRAVDSDIDVIEFDVMLFQDQFVMAHDEDDAAGAGEALLSLKEGLEILSQGDSKLSCDIKTIGREEEIKKELMSFYLQDRTLICGHFKKSLQVFQGTFPLGWSLPQADTSLENIIAPADLLPQELKTRIYTILQDGAADWAQGLMLRYDVITKDIANLLHSKGMWLTAWTVDDTAIARELISLGVDNITSNYPFQIKD